MGTCRYRVREIGQGLIDRLPYLAVESLLQNTVNTTSRPMMVPYGTVQLLIHIHTGKFAQEITYSKYRYGTYSRYRTVHYPRRKFYDI